MTQSCTTLSLYIIDIFEFTAVLSQPLEQDIFFQPSPNQDQPCLTAGIRREAVFPCWPTLLFLLITFIGFKKNLGKTFISRSAPTVCSNYNEIECLNTEDSKSDSTIQQNLYRSYRSLFPGPRAGATGNGRGRAMTVPKKVWRTMPCIRVCWSASFEPYSTFCGWCPLPKKYADSNYP